MNLLPLAVGLAMVVAGLMSPGNPLFNGEVELVPVIFLLLQFAPMIVVAKSNECRQHRRAEHGGPVLEALGLEELGKAQAEHGGYDRICHLIMPPSLQVVVRSL